MVDLDTALESETVEVYKPNTKIVVALSFEGFLNDGVTECGLTSSNAWNAVEPGRYLFGVVPVEAEDVDLVRGTREMKAFHLLRPLVEVAADYLNVMRVIEAHPDLVDTMLANPSPETFDPLVERFKADVTTTEEARERFGAKKVGAFYAERTRAQERNYDAWQATQAPFMDAVEELRLMRGTWTFEGSTLEGNPFGEVVAGLVPVFATSKDEKSTLQLCKTYSNRAALEVGEVGEEVGCILGPRKIIGSETTTDKVKQLSEFSRRENVPYGNVWRVNDRFDQKQQGALAKAGFAYQFFVKGGYAFPHEAKQAEGDSHLVVVPRKGLAVALGNYARQCNF